MRTGKTRICEICGQVIQPGGMGGHVRLKHGIIVKTVVKQVREVSREVSGDVRGVREVSGQVRDVSDVREQRPSDYVKKRSEVTEVRKDRWEYVGEGWGLKCNKCEWYIPKPDKDNDCPMGGKHNFDLK
jgi:Zn finger protein HypA/HybF involved in hydrogenase expression